MWLKVRTIGDLQILSRASYLMLILVPLLAGIWPAVKSGINEYNNIVIESRLAFEAASERLEFVASTIEHNNSIKNEYVSVLNALKERVNKVLEDYSHLAIEKDSLPSVWALAFLASLSVMIAHLLYQAFAPVLIKRITIGGYVTESLKNFVEHPSDGQLERAKQYSDHSEKKYEKSSKQDNYANSDIKIRTEEEKIAEDKKRLEFGIIEKGAVGQYLQDASRSTNWAIASGFFYIVGILILLHIIITQTTNVVTAAWG